MDGQNLRLLGQRLNGQDEAVPPPAQRKHTPVIKSADTSANTSATGSGPSKVAPMRNGMPMGSHVGSRRSWFKNGSEASFRIMKTPRRQLLKTHRRVLEALLDEITHQD